MQRRIRPFTNTDDPITTTIRDIPSEVLLSRDEGLPQDCVANFDNIVTIPKAKLDELITTLPLEKVLEAEQAIRFALGFEDLL